MSDPWASGRFPQFKSGAWTDIEDVVSREQAITLVIRGSGDGGEIRRSLWAHPQDLETLAVGHAKLEHCRPDQDPVLSSATGSEFVLDIRGGQPPAPEFTAPTGLSGSVVLSSMETLMEAEGLWSATGCFHRAGLWDPKTRGFSFVAQDIGRHNCLDRLAGWALANNADPREHVLFCSARLTASLAAKARKLGCVMAVSRSAVTTGALDMAAEVFMTVVGFTRQGRLTVFQDPAGRVAQ